MKTPATDPAASEILTPEEIEETIREALKVARDKKQGAINTAEYSKKIYAEQQSMILTAEQFYNQTISKAGKAIQGFSLTKEEKKIYYTLCQYFTNDQAFEKNGMELKKGLMLWGKIGCGKTTLMKLLSDNQRLSYAVIPCRTITKEFMQGGEDGKGGVREIEKYEKLIPFSMGSKFGHKEIGICFDDFGTESAAVNYGNKLNVMAEIFYSRYENNVPTHITTNLSPEEIERDYGPRIRSRMREMFNQIIFPETSKDKRK